jgi:phage/plasmid-like protein (TIGR03299 family)
MAYAGEVPWHGLGVHVNDDMTPEEMCIAAGLDWEVELRQLFFAGIQDGEQWMLKAPRKFAVVRKSDNRCYGVASDNWHPLQNRDMLEFFDKYIKAGALTLETAGSLRNGQLVWGLAKLSNSFEVTPGDRVNGYVLISGSHAPGKANTVQTTPVRVVCNNTWTAAQSESTLNFSQSHLKEFDMDTARLAIEAAHENLAAAEARCKTLAALNLNVEDAMRKVIAPVMLPNLDISEVDFNDLENEPKSLRDLIDSINFGPGATPGNAWGAFNGVTNYTSHIAGRSQESRLYRAWVGDNATRVNKVEAGLLELAA